MGDPKTLKQLLKGSLKVQEKPEQVAPRVSLNMHRFGVCRRSPFMKSIWAFLVMGLALNGA